MSATTGFSWGLALCVLPLAAVALEDEAEQQIESILVTATRSGNVVGDEPVRVEVVPEEEIEENLTIQPGNLTTLLNELAGARMQSTTTSLGGTALQMRGMPGRHSLVLQDGLPLLGAQTDGFGLLQIPPLDLGRVELVKGVGSALYGASALAGVLNLVSRRPGTEPELLLNRTSRGATDVVGFASREFREGRGVTLTAAVNDQSREDIDRDAWADLAGYRRYALRPRLFWDDEGRSIFATVGFVDEDRQGGTMRGRTLADGTSLRDALDTRRYDGGLTMTLDLGNDRQLATRWSAGVVDHERRFGMERIEDSLATGYGESTIAGHAGAHAWLLGGAVQYERLQSDDAPDAAYRYVTPAVFAQDEFAASDALKLAVSARIDDHNDYGTFFSPRLSALLRTGDDWSVRASIGTGFAAPTPLLEEIEATSLAHLAPLRGLEAERAASASLDTKWAEGGWEVEGSLFASRIRHPLIAEPSASQPDLLVVMNADAPRRVAGAELLVRYVAGPLHVIGSSTFMDATEGDPAGGRRRSDRVPRWSGELAALLEDEDRGRFGVEVSYTGRQALFDNPYRTTGRAYVEINALAEIKLGEISVFFNAINLTDVRQSDYDPLLLPQPAATGERVVSAWAPLAGRTFNLGVRLEL
ncbi:MAG TPA: TonB-dependent receptor [Steroidobacteraceae bacterium]|nr:TonB-dependent receptor [Steroidobacteraceae bacterium]